MVAALAIRRLKRGPDPVEARHRRGGRRKRSKRRGWGRFVERPLLVVLLLGCVLVLRDTVLSIVADEATVMREVDVMRWVLGATVLIALLGFLLWDGRADVRTAWEGTNPATARRPGHIVVTEQATGPQGGSRPSVLVDTRQGSLDWLNGGARFGIALVLPVIGSVVSLLHPNSNGWWAGLLWMLVLALGPWLAWEAWMVLLDDTSMETDRDRTVLSGRTQWPICRPRSVRLDQLTRVRYLTMFNGRFFLHYLVFVDSSGGRIMVEEGVETRNAARWGITLSVPVDVGGTTRRRLMSQSVPLLHIIVAVASVAAFCFSALFSIEVIGDVGAER